MPLRVPGVDRRQSSFHLFSLELVPTDIHLVYHYDPDVPVVEAGSLNILDRSIPVRLPRHETCICLQFDYVVYFLWEDDGGILCMLSTGL